MSALENREYGTVRWHSQFKRLQRYNALAPGLFPQVLELGHNSGEYFFDMEYLEGYQDLKTFLCTESLEVYEIEKIIDKIFVGADQLHSISTFESYPGTLNVYFEEECSQRLIDAREDTQLNAFSQQPTIIFDGRLYPGFEAQIEWVKDFISSIQVRSECFTHGNLTLENILIHPKTFDVRLIDPYDENIIDCAESDFSQILQCSSSHYGILNDSNPVIGDNTIDAPYEIPRALIQFNEIYVEKLFTSGTGINVPLVDFLHLSQFLRMLPFKVQSGHPGKAILFYAVACRLVDEMRVKYGN